MESKDEWEHLRNISQIKNYRWYIGLKKERTSQKWCWQTNPKHCINQTFPSPGKRRWASTEPNNPYTEDCVQMYEDGSYNSVPCKFDYGDTGYICEEIIGKERQFTFNHALWVNPVSPGLFFFRSWLKAGGRQILPPLRTSKASELWQWSSVGK